MAATCCPQYTIRCVPTSPLRRSRPVDLTCDLPSNAASTQKPSPRPNPSASSSTASTPLSWKAGAKVRWGGVDSRAIQFRTSTLELSPLLLLFSPPPRQRNPNEPSDPTPSSLEPSPSRSIPPHNRLSTTTRTTATSLLLLRRSVTSVCLGILPFLRSRRAPRPRRARMSLRRGTGKRRQRRRQRRRLLTLPTWSTSSTSPNGAKALQIGRSSTASRFDASSGFRGQLLTWLLPSTCSRRRALRTRSTSCSGHIRCVFAHLASFRSVLRFRADPNP